MFKFLQRRQRRKLYEGWVKSSGLSPEDIPPDFEDSPERKPHRRPPGGAEFSGEDNAELANYNTRLTEEPQHIVLPLRPHHIFWIGLLVILLIIALTAMTTILVLKSC